MTATRPPAGETAKTAGWSKKTPPQSSAEADATGAATPACNNGYELSGKAVTVAWRNAKRMVAEGYLWLPDGVFYHLAGCVLSPLDTCYDVWLPGVWRNHPEGKCTCPFFAANHICKHIYFAVAQIELLKAFAPAIPVPPATAATPAPGF